MKGISYEEGGAKVSLLPSDLSKLRGLPFFETLDGHRVSLPEGAGASSAYYTIDDRVSGDDGDDGDQGGLLDLLPEASKGKFLKEKSGWGELLTDVGVTKLEEALLLSRFVLPNYLELGEGRKTKIKERIRKNWERYRLSEGFKEVLGETKFVTCGTGGVCVYRSPKELYDPRNEILRDIFYNGEGGDGDERFPAEEFASPEWLNILAAVGMNKDVDKSTFLECARKVEKEWEEGVETAVAKAVKLHMFLSESFGDFFDASFARTLGNIRCVPAEVFGTGGEVARVLKTFSEVGVPKDRALLFTHVPVIPDGLAPPMVMYR